MPRMPEELVISDGRGFSPSATERKSAQRFKAGSGRGIGFVPDASDCFFCAWKNDFQGENMQKTVNGWMD